MQSFRDLDRHFGAASPETVNALVAIAASASRQTVFADQHPAELESLRQVALVQSAESSNAIEDIRAPRKRIEALVAQATEPANRSEQEIAGYRFVLDTIHGNAHSIPFEPRFIEQLHGYMARFTGDRTAGAWKKLDNQVQDVHPGGTKVVRFEPVSADDTPAAMRELHERLNAARADGTYDELRLSSAYVFDFLVIHPFRDGNGRMSRLATLWLLYLGGHEVGRYVSLEKIIEDSRDTYYQALAKSTVGWHEGEHDLSPWLSYFLGIVVAAYKEFEDRTGLVGGRGSKRARIERFIETNLSDEFTIAEVRQASPQASDSYIRVVLGDLKASRAIEPVGRGRGASWRRLDKAERTAQSDDGTA